MARQAAQVRFLITMLRALLLMLVIAAPCGFVIAQGAVENKKVLMLFGDDASTATQTMMERALRSTLRDGSPVPVELYSEYVSNKLAVQDHTKELVALLGRKYSGKKIDLIVCIGSHPLRLSLSNRAELFTDTPIVFLTIDKRNIADLVPAPGSTGVWGEIDFKSNLALALSLHPATKRVVLMQGASEVDRFWAEKAKHDFREYRSGLEFSELAGLTIPEMRSALARQPPDTIVFFISNIQDRTGNAYESPEYLRQVSSASTAPIYGTTEAHLGVGAVGGSILSFAALGEEAGRVGLRVLAGEEPDTIAPYGVANRLLFDWRELQRWNISESSLPEGSIVRFKEPSLWEKYRWSIFGLLLALSLETGLIAWLVIMRARRRKAEMERNEFQALAEREHNRLKEIVRNVPGVVWESRISDDPDERETVFISDYVKTLFGYDPDEYKATKGIINNIVVEEQREWFAKELRQLFASGDGLIMPFKIRTQSGEEKWVEGHIAVVRDETGKPVAMRGVTMDITDRKSAEEMLAAKQMQLAEAQRLAQVGSWEWDEETGFVTWSDEIYRIYGLDPSQRAPSFEEQERLFVAESWERLNLAVANTLMDGNPYEIEVEFIRAGGGTGWGSARGELVIQQDGSRGLRGTLQDVSGRKRAEEFLRESEARFRTLADSAPVLIWMTDTNAEWTFFNRRALEFTGMTIAELRGSQWMRLVHNDDRQFVMDVYAKANALKENYKMEYRLLDANGDYRWLHDTGVPHFSPNGNLIGFIGTCTDITELKTAETALRESEERFRNIADSAPVLIWMWDAEGRNTFINKVGLDFTGLTKDDFRGRGWLHPVHRHDQKSLDESYRKGQELHQSVVAEFRLRRADGEYRWFYSTSAPRFDADGHFLGLIGTCVDIEDRKQAERALQLAITEIDQLKNKLQEENFYLKEEIKLIHDFDEMIGESEALKYVLFKIEQVAPTNATVLITGETGTGKEMVARAVHGASYLKHMPLVKVNCAALAANFIESELFGHEKGAFTGAIGKRIGRFELAQGGTIFLDEIGELPLDLQVKLLRFLQEGEFERLGSSKTIKVDVRVIAATNRDLRAEVEKGNFREDLLFRLNVFPITVPPLRERKDDIPLLVNYFVQRFCKRLGKKITSVSQGVMRTLMDHSWPGNIRELANVIERSVISTKGETFKTVEGLDSATASNGSGVATATLEQVERDYISQILKSTDWKIEGKGGAARILGLNPSTLRTRMQKLGIWRVARKTNGS